MSLGEGGMDGTGGLPLSCRCMCDLQAFWYFPGPCMLSCMLSKNHVIRSMLMTRAVAKTGCLWAVFLSGCFLHLSSICTNNADCRYLLWFIVAAVHSYCALCGFQLTCSLARSLNPLPTHALTALPTHSGSPSFIHSHIVTSRTCGATISCAGETKQCIWWSLSQ